MTIRTAISLSAPKSSDLTIVVELTVEDAERLKVQIEHLEYKDRLWPLAGLLEAIDKGICQAYKELVNWQHPKDGEPN